jgi:hypothetical protein
LDEIRKRPKVERDVCLPKGRVALPPPSNRPIPSDLEKAKRLAEKYFQSPLVRIDLESAKQQAAKYLPKNNNE